MPFPVQDRLKNLIESTTSAQLPTWDGHPFNDAMYTGVVAAIVASGSNYFLQVVPLQPASVSADGVITIDDGTHPLAEVGTPYSFERVVPQNIPLNLVPLYFSVGQRIKYFCYSAGQANLDQTVGSYATWVDDLSFFGEINWTCTCGSGNASGGGSAGGGSSSGACIVHAPPTATGPVAWSYGFIAQTYNPASTTLSGKFSPFSGLSGTAYNLAEVLNTTGTGDNPTGSGVFVDDYGYRYDDQTSEEKIVPIGPTIARIYPLVNPNSNICNFKEFYFGPMTNQFADQNSNQTGCCPSTSGSSQSQSSNGCCSCYEVKFYAQSLDQNFDINLSETGANSYAGGGATLVLDGGVWYLTTPDGSVFQSTPSPCPPTIPSDWTCVVGDGTINSVNCCGSSSSSSSRSGSGSGSGSNASTGSGGSGGSTGGSTSPNCVEVILAGTLSATIVQNEDGTCSVVFSYDTAQAVLCPS